MGRIVTLVTTVPPDRFLATTWPILAGMGLVVLVARLAWRCFAISSSTRRSRRRHRPDPLAGPWHVVRQSWRFSRTTSRAASPPA